MIIWFVIVQIVTNQMNNKSDGEVCSVLASSNKKQYKQKFKQNIIFVEEIAIKP